MILPPLDPRRARDLIANFPGRRVLVVGDVMIDRFIVGSVTRISAEAPVPVVRFQSEYSRLGGAANVANNLAALGARVFLVGMVGADAAGARLRDQLSGAGIAATLVQDASRPTIEKVRIVTGRNQQVARIDYEQDDDATEAVARDIVAAAAREAEHAEAIVVSDYLKGTVTRTLVPTLSERRAPGAPILVDPKIPHLDYYAGATLITPNHVEAETATRRRIQSHEDARAAAIDLRTLARCDAALVTRGEHGMWLSSGHAEGAIPSVAREVSDVTGAGDTVVATLGLALAAGASMAEAAALANQAAGIKVGKFGPATVTPEELAALFSGGM